MHSQHSEIVMVMSGKFYSFTREPSRHIMYIQIWDSNGEIIHLDLVSLSKTTLALLFYEGGVITG